MSHGWYVALDGKQISPGLVSECAAYGWLRDHQGDDAVR